jgi:hypothetical protein
MLFFSWYIQVTLYLFLAFIIRLRLIDNLINSQPDTETDTAKRLVQLLTRTLFRSGGPLRAY